jgi:hypothetical protein
MRDVRVTVERVRLAAPGAGGMGRGELGRRVARDLQRLFEDRHAPAPATVSAAVARALHDRIAAEGGQDASTR